MTKAHDFTPEFLQTPGLHLVRLGVLQRYVAQEDDQPVGVRAGEEFTVLRHNRNQPALPLTSEQELFLRDLDSEKPLDANMLTQDEVDFVLTLLKQKALLPVLSSLPLRSSAELLSQLRAVPVFRQSLHVDQHDVLRGVYVVQPVLNRPDSTDEDDDAEGVVPEALSGAPSFELSDAAMNLVVMHMTLTNDRQEQAVRDGLLSSAPRVTLGEAAEEHAQRLFRLASRNAPRSSEFLADLRQKAFSAALEVVTKLTRSAAFSFEAVSDFRLGHLVDEGFQGEDIKGQNA